MDVNKLLQEAPPPHEGQNAANEFAKRMAEMQQGLQQMEKVKHEMQKDKTQLQKMLQPLQRELDDVSKQLTSAQHKRQKLEKELKACEADIIRLSQKKETAQAKLFAVTAEAENKRVGKLNAVVGSMPGVEKSALKQQEEGGGDGNDLMDGLFSGPAVASAVAPATDLLDFGGSSSSAACPNSATLGDFGGSSSSAACPHSAPVGGVDAGLGGLNFSATTALLPQPCAVQMPAVAGMGGMPYGGMGMGGPGFMAPQFQQQGLVGSMLAANPSLEPPAPLPPDHYALKDPFMNLLMGPNSR
mmetsp:Transcript_70282/g.131448  ORF Transcript_70282/g.131448 Transcript_70282/m.131448 type:complete len:300 (+) Transcript_70282:77-976(+)